MMRDLREKTKIVMIVVALAFVGLMVFEWGMDISGSSVASQTGELGRVNGEPVPYEAYSLAYQQMYDQARARTDGQLSREQIREIEDAAFNEVVNDILLRQEIRRMGIEATDREVVQAAQWMPHPELMQNEIFLTNGQFDISKYQDFLSGPSANEDLLMQLESYYRATIPRSKLVRQVTAGIYLSDAELWRMWRDRNETATIEYVPLTVSVLVPGDVEVTDREIRAYYDENEEEFERAASARVRLAYIEKGVAEMDTVAALESIRDIRNRIVNGGEDFATVAQSESDDAASAIQGGSLGSFGRGQMVAPFEEAAFGLEVGEISEPVRTDFGYHIIEVTERTDDEVTARHILVDFEPSDAALDRLYARADSLEMVAERAGFDRAVRTMNATVHDDVLISLDEAFVPGVGSAVEAVEWARDEQLMEEPLDLSPVFETPQAFYLIELEEFIEPGMISLQEASPEIRRQLIVEKKRERARSIGQEIVAEVRGGKTLEAAVQERGLQVNTTGPFTRAGVNPAIGQANAVTGAAFGVPIGQVSDVVESSAGLFIVRPLDRTEASREDFETQKESLRRLATLELQQEVLARWMDDLRAEADILDRRDEARNAAAQAPPQAFPL